MFAEQQMERDDTEIEAEKKRNVYQLSLTMMAIIMLNPASQLSDFTEVAQIYWRSQSFQ